jgi:hypothetical protein
VHTAAAVCQWLEENTTHVKYEVLPTALFTKSDTSKLSSLLKHESSSGWTQPNPGGPGKSLQTGPTSLLIAGAEQKVYPNQ